MDDNAGYSVAKDFFLENYIGLDSDDSQTFDYLELSEEKTRECLENAGLCDEIEDVTEDKYEKVQHELEVAVKAVEEARKKLDKIKENENK
jgi:hypothetical protein